MQPFTLVSLSARIAPDACRRRPDDGRPDRPIDVAAADAKTKQGPNGGAFYKPPKQVPNGHGKVIWQRDATKLAPIDGAKVNKTILYTSRSPQGDRIAVSGSVSVPKGKAPKGGWPVISYAHGTTGAADSCAPTRVRPNSVVAPLRRLRPPAAPGLDRRRLRGRRDRLPGPRHSRPAPLPGRRVARAAASSTSSPPPASSCRASASKFLIAGHSQGGQSALFAAGLAKSWAPKLKLKGTVSYAPASHIYEQAEVLPSLTSPSGLSALAATIFEGASTTSADIKAKTCSRPRRRRSTRRSTRPAWRSSPEPDSFGGVAPADLLQEPIDNSPDFAGVLKEMNPDLKIGPPVLLAQGLADTTVFPSFTDLLNGQLVDRGDDVNYKTYPGITHGQIVAAAEDDVMDFFEQRLPGR